MRFLVLMGLAIALGACAEATAGKPAQVVTGTLRTCAMAFADWETGKAGGGQTGAMNVVCTAKTSTKWSCVTTYPDEPDKSQLWSLTSKTSCDFSSSTARACLLKNPEGTLHIEAAGAEGIGLMRLRLDLGVGKAVGAKVCAGDLTLGV